jgi:gamma-glutamylputrescine oxidase
MNSRSVERIDTCEVVVIGAGLVGAVVAANLVAEGLDVAVLEARSIASGATGRTAGSVFTGLPTPYVQLVERHGRETAQALWQLTVDNRVRLISAADRLGVDLERTGSLMVATDNEQADQLEASAEMLIADGFDVRFRATDFLGRGFAGALHYPDDVVVDTVTLTEKLLRDIRTHISTEVYGLELEGDDVLVLARGRTVKASTVVLAVNAYAPLLDDYFADRVAPIRGHIFVTRPLEEDLVEIPGSTGSFSFRQTSDGRLLFTAWRPQYETPATGPSDESAEIDLMRFVGRYFPEATDQFAHRWSSILGASTDGLPLIGALPHLSQVFFAVGFAGYGMSLAFAATDLLTGLIVRGAEPTLLSARRLE